MPTKRIYVVCMDLEKKVNNYFYLSFNCLQRIKTGIKYVVNMP